MHPDFDPTLEVGVKELDVDHRRLFGAIRRIMDHVSDGRLATVGAELKDLERDLHEHTVGEEGWMAEHAYPARLPHERAHGVGRALLALAQEEGQEAARRADRTAQLMLLARVRDLESWMERHLRLDDLRLARFRRVREGVLHGDAPG